LAKPPLARGPLRAVATELPLAVLDYHIGQEAVGSELDQIAGWYLVGSYVSGVLNDSIDGHPLLTWAAFAKEQRQMEWKMEWKDALPIAKQIWQVLNRNLDLFFIALQSPRRVIARWKRDSTETVRRAFVFSLVPVTIAYVFDLPYWVFYVPSVLTIWGIAGIFALYYVQTAIESIMLFVVGWLLRGKASLRDCIAATLVFMAVKWPANELVAWGMKPDKVLLCARTTGTYASPSWEKVDPSYMHYYFWLQVPLIVYFLLAITPAIRHVQRVGRFRALIIYLSYFITSGVLSDALLKPLFAKIFNCT
jgi:hypothetical protein